MDVVLVGKAGDRMRNPMLNIAKRNLAGTSYDVCSRLLVGLVANCGFAFLSCFPRQAMRWTGGCNGRRRIRNLESQLEGSSTKRLRLPKYTPACD